MTAQLHDLIQLDGVEYSLVGVHGSPLFDATGYGIPPLDVCTACYRGHHCQYRVVDQHLVLDVLAIAVRGHVSPPPMNGRRPAKVRRKYDFFTHEYTALALPIPFTGGLLLGTELIRALHANMGFQPAWKYGCVKELLVEAGQVTRVRDRSDEASVLRERFAEEKQRAKKGHGGADFGSTEAEALARIERCFSLDYAKSDLKP